MSSASNSRNPLSFASWNTIEPCSQPPLTEHEDPSPDLQMTTWLLRLMASPRARCNCDRKSFENELNFITEPKEFIVGSGRAIKMDAMASVANSSTSVKPWHWRRLAKCVGGVRRIARSG